MTLKQSQGHQTYSENVDPEQDYSHTKFERSRYESVREKDNVKGCFFFCLFVWVFFGFFLVHFSK